MEQTASASPSGKEQNAVVFAMVDVGSGVGSAADACLLRRNADPATSATLRNVTTSTRESASDFTERSSGPIAGSVGGVVQRSSWRLPTRRRAKDCKGPGR